MPDKSKSTKHGITKRKKVTPAHTNPPWGTVVRDKRYAKLITINPARPGLTKEDAAKEHQMQITKISQDADYIIIYTDGSVKGRGRKRRTGAGWVLYWKGEEKKNGSEGMGRDARVHDAEMLALLRGLETSIEFWQTMPEGNRKQCRIVLYSDNTSSVASITNKKLGSISRKFVETTKTFLGASIEVSWVPGHQDITGNDRADELAKKATELQPATETSTSCYATI